jgi:transcriptional regulator
MYCPASFREDRLEVLHALMRSHRLASLVTAGEGGLLANLVPFTLVAGSPAGGPGLLRAHLARAKGQVDALRAGTPALVIFHGPQSYVTPSW